MKILYIPSGFKRIYLYFDQSILKSLSQLDYQVKSFHVSYGDEALKKMISSFKPDLILTMVGFKLTPSILSIIKKSKVPTAIWMTEDPYYTDKTIDLIHHFHYVFTIESSCVEFYTAAGHKNIHHLPLGTNPDIYSPQLENKNSFFDLCFVGYPYPERVKLTKYLLDHSSYTILTIGGNWHLALPSYNRKPNLKIINQWMTPKRVSSFYSNTKIILNSHRPFQYKYNRNEKGVVNNSINNRTFDIACCEAFQLIDRKRDLYHHFNEEKEIVSFTSMEDLLAKINYYHQHENERIKIAKKARQKVLENDTFIHRLIKMMSIIKK
ncbi:CgeB family protein [Alkalihalobacterium elongatum]|uniref:CgeB family protein n=1 Tax=Alkalihalobacterium elongatum TaxID=2675466 RepID=UPI001C1F333C|nr:glycosyltransferase [Alkalihalobacterium elongatum]